MIWLELVTGQKHPMSCCPAGYSWLHLQEGAEEHSVIRSAAILTESGGGQLPMLAE